MSRIAAAAAGVALLVVALVVGALVYDRTREDRVAPGVTVAGVDVGDRSAAQARDAVRKRVARPAARDVVVEHGDETFELTAEKANLEVDVDATVQAALDAGRDGTFLGRTLDALTGEEVDADIEPRLRYDEQAVDEFVDHVERDANHMADDAKVEPSGSGLEVTESSKGFRTDREELEQRVTETIERPRGERTLDVPGETLEPDTTLDDLKERHPHFITVDRGGFRLRHYTELEHEKTYRISVGRAGHETPEGLYDISTKAKDPVWYVPDEPWAGEKRGEQIPPGPENPLKARWLGIEDGVGIHGTDETESIGSRASHGCIRMLIPDVKQLYAKVPTGTPVYIG